MRIILILWLGFATCLPWIARADDSANPALVRETMAMFADGLKRGDLSALHAASGPTLKKQYTAGQILAQFSSFPESGVDLTILESIEPVLSQEQRQGGVLSLAGFYPTLPSRAYFNFSYEQADGRWALRGIGVRIVPLVKASTMRHNAGWTISLDLLEPASEIEYAVTGGEFRSTGHSSQRDPATGESLANTQISVAELPESLQLKLVTRSGPVGPITLTFDGEASIVKQDIETLEMTRGSWAMQRTYHGELLYFTHLVSYRCGIDKVRYSVGSEALDREYPLPPCDMKDPHSIPRDFEIVKLDRWYPFVAVQLDFKDGRRSEIVRIPHPDPQPIKPGVEYLIERRAAVVSASALLTDIVRELPAGASLDEFGIDGTAARVRARGTDGTSLVAALQRVGALQDVRAADAADTKDRYASGSILATARPGRGDDAPDAAFLKARDFHSAAADLSQRMRTLLARAGTGCERVMEQPMRSADDEVYERVSLRVRLRCENIGRVIPLFRELEGGSPTMFLDDVAVRTVGFGSGNTMEVGFTLSVYRE